MLFSTWSFHLQKCFHFLLSPDNSASLRHGDFNFSALFRAGINIRPEWSNRKWTGVKTSMMRWEAFEIRSLRSHSEDVWARKWLQSFISVYAAMTHSLLSWRLQQNKKLQPASVNSRCLWIHRNNPQEFLKVKKRWLLWLMKSKTIILLHESQICQETTYHTWLYFVPC